MSFFKKQCDVCGQKLDKKDLHVFDTTPDLVGERRGEIIDFKKRAYKDGKETRVCGNCARQELYDYFDKYTHTLVIVEPNRELLDRFSYTYYSLDELRLYPTQDIINFVSDLEAFIQNNTNKCECCDETAQFLIVDMDFFEKSDPMSWAISKNDTNVKKRCKKCFANKDIEHIDIPKFVFPPLDISDGIFTPWEV